MLVSQTGHSCGRCDQLPGHDPGVDLVDLLEQRQTLGQAPLVHQLDLVAGFSIASASDPSDRTPSILAATTSLVSTP
jgi:hypothetical protein